MFKNKKGFIIKLRQSRTFKGLSAFMLLSFLFEIAQPTVSLALTEGPSQPEVQSFEPIGTTQMVDAFTGDFNYNIPLFNLPGPNGGYPVNIAYHAGVSMDDEASWVGLGWNINVGSLVRSMRGLPDEFESELAAGKDDEAAADHDYLEVKSDIKQSWTLGATRSWGAEAVGLGIDKLTKAGGLDLSLNLSVYYNNYNGVGISTGANFGLNKSNYSFGISLDTENGMGVSADYSLDAKKTINGIGTSHKLSLSFDGSLSVDYTLTARKRVTITKSEYGFKKGGGLEMVSNKYSVENKNSYGSGVSFARNNYIPSIANKLNSYSLSVSYKQGVESPLVVFPYTGISVFYNTQDMDKDDIDGRKRPVIGYAKAGNKNNSKFTRDFIRSNDGQITKDSKFLAYSQYAYDVYNSTGQGLSGYFRPRRSDIGRSFDPEIVNNTYGLTFGYDAGVGSTAKVGVDGSAIFGYSSQGAWDINNDLSFDFTNPEPKGIDENVYYQAHGEPTILEPGEMDFIKGTHLPQVFLASKQDFHEGGKRKIGVANNYAYANKRNVTKRAIRNTLIHNLKNKEVSHLGEFDVKYFSNYDQVLTSTPTASLDRSYRGSVKIDNHPAGYKVLNQEGSYYVYALPAYNNKEIENLFSVQVLDDAENVSELDYELFGNEVDYKLKYLQSLGNLNELNDGLEGDKLTQSHKFINKTTKSPYAHSHLLSSVQGADYVDIDNNGPSDEDLGYWVKFNYVKYADNYKWRAPYTKAKFHKGQVYTTEDDKASYQYGEKEMWYLGQMETKSHIAVFKMSERKDMKESTGEHNDGTSVNSGLRVDEIRIYEKKSFLNDPGTAVALQVVHFEYDYSLCKNAPNSVSSTHGKLTLKSIYFTSNGSERGKKNRYHFNYGSNPTANNPFFTDNPDYALNSVDPWGMYKPYDPLHGNLYEHYANLPYVNQFNQDWNNAAWEPQYTNTDAAEDAKITKDYQDKLAGAWCLKEIKLPSGGKINIDYESDDYGYVQHKTANQMFKIHKLGDFANPDEIYNSGNFDDYSQANIDTDEKRRRIYFKLETPIPTNTDHVGSKIYDRYVKPIIQDENGERNLYFKTKMRLTHNVYDYVSGYLPLEEFYPSDQNLRYGCLSDANSDASGMYTYGYVTIKAAVKRKKENGNVVYFDDYHPMALAGWTYLQTNAQKLLHNPNSLQNEGYYSGLDLLNKLADLLNIIPSVATNFGMIRAYCKSKDMARYIDLDHSVIKLASPDKIKYGGGHRVKQISITDNWSGDTDNAERDNTYGQSYDYTIDESYTENGEIKSMKISSGVAQYEPQACGDENPLKYPIYYFGKQNVLTKNNLFAEAPLNEDMFPGASVGYRKVTTRSLNTKKRMDQKVDPANNGGDPKGRTGGVTVQEFYTAKEFPTLVEYSDLAEENFTKDVFNLPIPIPLIGSFKRHYYHGTQAYKIELNDMHGKPKSTQSFELNDYKMNDTPLSSSFYEYQADPIEYQGEKVLKLNNEVDVIINDGTHKIQPVKRSMGIEYDLYTDQRETKTFHQDAGLEYNVDLVLTIPGTTVWPSFNNHKTIMRTYVTNKVIHRTGILKKTISQDLQTTNETEVVAYDEKSGQPLVSKIKNEFGDYFYSYNIPAYYQYDRMGHAYQNINYNFTTVISNVSGDRMHSGSLFKFIPTTEQKKYLVKGDELITSNICVPTATSNYTLNFKKDLIDPRVADIDFTLTNVPLENGYSVQLTDANGHTIVIEYTQTSVSGSSHFYTVTINGVTYYDVEVRGPQVYYDCSPITDKVNRKCYFLGWKYGDDPTGDDHGIQYGLLSFVEPLGSGSSDMEFTADLKVIRSGRRNHYSAMVANYLTKGLINTQNLASTTLKTNNGKAIETRMIESNLLSATASLYRDDWSSNFSDSDLESASGSLQAVDRDINPFLSGNSGIFRPYKSYTYVGPRKASANMASNATGGNPNLKTDGVFTGVVKMFSWELGNMEDYVSNWEWVNEVTRFSNDSYEIENVNRLGIYSSALYGYDNSLTLAVGGNASYHELGSDDFETTPLQFVDWRSDDRMKQNNMNFYKDPSSKNHVIVSETSNIKNADFENGVLKFTIDKPSEYVKTFMQGAVNGFSDFALKSTFGISLTSERSAVSNGNESYFLNGSCKLVTYNATTDKLDVEIVPYHHSLLEPTRTLPNGSVLHGKITMYEKRPMINTVDNNGVINISSTKAHTGKKSMQVKNTVVFDQPMLKAIKNKKYITSVWVSRAKNRVTTYKPTNGTDLVVPGYMSGSNFNPFSGYKITYGKVIEGWQKIDLEFTSTEENAIVAFKFIPGGLDLFVDDIRYSPKTGGITTYVYDPVKFWLRASLNVDNYATLFFYDEEGNLTVKKQETEKGIFTITESRGHVSEPMITEQEQIFIKE